MEKNKLNPFIRIRGIKGRGYDIAKELTKRGADLQSWEKIDRKNLDNYWLYISGQGKILSVPVDGAEPFFLDHYEEVKLPGWRAEDGEGYFFVSDEGVVVRTIDFNVHYDRIRYKIGNYFQTAEEAEPFRDKFLEMLKGR